MPAIYEGIRNRIFKKEDIEEIAAIRWSICIKCNHLDTIGKNCTLPGTQPCCTLCGCAMQTKTRSLISSCPDGKMGKILKYKRRSKSIKRKFKIKVMILTAEQIQAKLGNIFKQYKYSHSRK